MKYRLSAVLLPAAVLVLSACGSDVTPQGLAPAPWFTIGKGPAGYTALDTSRVEKDGARRVVWVRTDYFAADSAPKVPGAVVKVRETRHRLDCGARMVGDLETILRDSSGTPLTARPGAGTPGPFTAHPSGGKVFATVCNALSIAARHRQQGR